MAEPPITLQALRDAGLGNLPPTRIVIHATAPEVGFPKASAAGMAAATARYFTSAAARGSAHYVVDVAGEQHCVPDSHIAWHAPPNAQSLGIEICAEATYTREQWLSGAVWPAVVRAAARTVELCTRHRIPLARLSPAAVRAGARGVCGHVDVSVAFGQSDHTDPGPGFPWAEFMTACQAALTPPGGGFLDALTPAEQHEVLDGIRALKPGLALPNRSPNARGGRVLPDGTRGDDEYGHVLNGEAEAADARVLAGQVLDEIRQLRTALGK